MATKQVNSSISGVTSGGSESRGNTSFASELNRQNPRRTASRDFSRAGGGLSAAGAKKRAVNYEHISFTGIETIDYAPNVLLAFGVGSAQGYGVPELDEGF